MAGKATTAAPAAAPAPARKTSSTLRLAVAFLPTLLSVAYFRWDSIAPMLQGSHQKAPSNAQLHTTNSVAAVTTPSNNATWFEDMRDQYAAACPRHIYSTRLFNADPLIVYLEDFIPVNERSYILQLAEGRYTSSEVTDAIEGSKLDKKSRSSHTAIIHKDPVLQCIGDRAANFQGRLPKENVEELQVLKYYVGDHFRAHYDWFEHENLNPRISTIFAYLACDNGNAGEGECIGGATKFFKYDQSFTNEWCDVVDCENDVSGVSFKPVAGNAVFWSNLYPNGTFHKGTLHSGMPVKQGRKIGLNIWTRRDRFTYEDAMLENDAIGTQNFY